MKKVLYALLTVCLLFGCSSNQSGNEGEENGNEPSVTPISVMSREEGSGTRGAFIELFGVEQKDANGNKVDYTTDEASITNSTAVMLSNVANDSAAIGYVSLGSLNATVKAVTIDGVKASVDNIKNGSYTVSRPFNIAIRDDLSDLGKDFVAYILSDQGKDVIEGKGYISVSSESYTSGNLEGKLVVSGSSSVSPLMEKLAEAYMASHAGVEIVLQTTDSSSGVSDAIKGLSDIGMASRDLKDSELSEGVESVTIAIDGIAVIVNKSNALDGLTKDQVKEIYLGNYKNWEDVK